MKKLIDQYGDLLSNMETDLTYTEWLENHVLKLRDALLPFSAIYEMWLSQSYTGDFSDFLRWIADQREDAGEALRSQFEDLWKVMVKYG